MCGDLRWVSAKSKFGTNYYTFFRSQKAWLEKKMSDFKTDLLLKMEEENEYYDSMKNKVRDMSITLEDI